MENIGLAKNKMIGQRIKKELRANKYIYILAIPVIIYYLIFCYWPMFGLVIAFKNYEVGKGIFQSSWVGLKNFTDFFSSVHFVRVFKNTLLISLYDLVISFPAAVIFALLLNELKNSMFKKTVQTITYLPHFISLVVVCGMITDFFSSDGIITRLLCMLGGKNINYLGYPQYFKSIYVWTNVWQNVGWNSIIYLAALAGVNTELYEAAKVDGANRFRQLITVTIPGIAPTIAIMLILKIGQMMSVGYEKIILLYNQSTYETADVISSFVYRRGLGESAQYSYSAAVGMFQSVINFVLLLSANHFSSKYADTSLF